MVTPVSLPAIQTFTHDSAGQSDQLDAVAEEEEQSEEEPQDHDVTTETSGIDQSEERVESHEEEEEGPTGEDAEEEKHALVSSDICYVSSRHKHGSSPQPYGLPCVRELLRFLISITNPRDK